MWASVRCVCRRGGIGRWLAGRGKLCRARNAAQGGHYSEGIKPVSALGCAKKTLARTHTQTQTHTHKHKHTNTQTHKHMPRIKKAATAKAWQSSHEKKC